MSNPNIIGRYINLDNSIDRRNAFESQLANLSFDWSISRFSAMQGDNRESKIKGGELGCFLSHQSIIDTHHSTNALAIFEDDAIILPEAKELIPAVLESLKNQVDIIFLGSGVDYANLEKIAKLIKLKNEHIDKNLQSKRASILDAREWYNHGTHAYILTTEGVKKTKKILSESAEKGYPTAIDNLYRTSIKNNKLSAVVVFPFLVEIDMNFMPTISTRADVPAAEGHELLYSAAANLFSINSNQENLLNWANNKLTPEEFDVDCFIASQILYRKFKMSK